MTGHYRDQISERLDALTEQLAEVIGTEPQDIYKTDRDGLEKKLQASGKWPEHSPAVEKLDELRSNFRAAVVKSATAAVNAEFKGAGSAAVYLLQQVLNSIR